MMNQNFIHVTSLNAAVRSRGHFHIPNPFARHGSNQEEQPEQVDVPRPYVFPKPGDKGWPTTRSEFCDKWNHSIDYETKRQQAAEDRARQMKVPEQDMARQKEEDVHKRFIREQKVFRVIFDMWTEEVHRKYRELWHEEMETQEATRAAEADV